LAFAVPQIETKSLELLEPCSAEPASLFDLAHSLLSEVRLVPALVVEVHVVEESTGKASVGEVLRNGKLVRRRAILIRPVERRDGASAQVNGNADADRIHDSQGECVAFGTGLDVFMQIDDAVRGAPPGRIIPGGSRGLDGHAPRRSCRGAGRCPAGKKR